MSREFKGYIHRCLACNRQLDTNESSRTFPNTDELIGVCNSCLSKTRRNEYDYPFEHATLTEGTSAHQWVDNHSSYYYEYID